MVEKKEQPKAKGEKYGEECHLHKRIKEYFCKEEEVFLCSECIEEHLEKQHKLLFPQKIKEAICKSYLQEASKEEVSIMKGYEEGAQLYGKSIHEELEKSEKEAEKYNKMTPDYNFNKMKEGIPENYVQQFIQSAKEKYLADFGNKQSVIAEHQKTLFSKGDKKFTEKLKSELNAELANKYEPELASISAKLKEAEKESHNLKNEIAYLKNENANLKIEISKFSKKVEPEKIEIVEPQKIEQIIDSKIITKLEEVDVLKKGLNAGKLAFKLLYRGSRDGFGSSAFHQKADNIKQTIILVKSKDHNRIFGGYNPLTWDPNQNGKYYADTTGKAFLFSITHKTCHNLIQENNQYAFCYNSGNGPAFGGGHDLCIASDCNQNNSSYSDLGDTYKLPEGMAYNTNEAKSYLAGSYYFTVAEIEAFEVAILQ